MSIIPNSIGDNGRGHGKDILIVNEFGVARLNVDSIHIWESTSIHHFMSYCQIWQKPLKNDARHVENH